MLVHQTSAGLQPSRLRPLIVLLVLGQLVRSETSPGLVQAGATSAPSGQSQSLAEVLHRRGLDGDQRPEPEVPDPRKNNDSAVKVDNQDLTQTANTASNGTELNDHKDPLRVEEILRQIFGAEFEDEDLENDEEELEEEFFGQLQVKEPVRDPTEAVEEVSRAEVSFLDLPKNRTRQGRGEPDSRRKRKPARGPSSKKNGAPESGGKQSGPRQKGKGKGRIDLTKYNAYMDAVLGRMNTLIRKKRMDPLRVNLYAGPSKAAAGPKRNQQNKKKSSPRSGPSELGHSPSVPAGRFNEPDAEDPEEEGEDESHHDDQQREAEDDSSVRDVTLRRDLGLGIQSRAARALSANVTETRDSDALETEPKKRKNEEGRKTGNKNQKPNNKRTGNSGNKKKQGSSESESESASAADSEEEVKKPVKNNNKNKNKNKNSPRPTRGILHGLSTLRRDGNVQVIKDGERARIVRAKFLLGPVALEILPKKVKGASREEQTSSTKAPAATATAPQLKGILEIRLSPRSPTRIRKLRVFPPGNIQVDGDRQAGTGGEHRSAGPGYRKVTPMATARLRQAAVQVVRQVDTKMRPRINPLE